MGIINMEHINFLAKVKLTWVQGQGLPMGFHNNF